MKCYGRSYKKLINHVVFATKCVENCSNGLFFLMNEEYQTKYMRKNYTNSQKFSGVTTLKVASG